VLFRSDVLEISKDADENEIKKSFRKMATKWHPDKNLNNREEATEKFKEISQAYEILSDPEKKEKYDKYGDDMDKMPDMSEMFNPFEGLFNGHVQNEKKLKKQEVIVKISLNNIYTGVTKKLKIKSMKKCASCNVDFKKCSDCDGKGLIIQIIRQGPMIQQLQCPCGKCKQTGFIKKNSKCVKCDGRGTIEEQEEIEICFNKNDDYLREIILKGKGNYNFETKKDNDVYIKFEIKNNDNNYSTNKYDIIYNYNINIKEALTCENLYLEHPNSKTYLLISDDIIKNNSHKIIPKMGIPSSYSSGNLIIQFNYIYPKNIITSEEFSIFINQYESSHKEKYETIKLQDLQSYQQKEAQNNDDDDDDMQIPGLNRRQRAGMQQQQCQQS